MTLRAQPDAPRRVALVTGASRGIGLGIATRLAADGFYVIGTATSATGVEHIDAALGAAGQGAALRIEDPDSVARLIEALDAGPGSPLVLVNNAGITRDNLVLRMKDEEWQSVIDANLTGLFRITRPLLRGMMKARWGRIINLSSVVARMGNAGQTNYVASKAGIEGFTRALALEVASRNITVNAVAPGFIDTDMTAALSEAQIAQMRERIPLGRTGAVDEVAHAVAFLASEGAGYVTGASVPVNGGLHMA
ncbi:MAG: 3-oxoacyl-ACP reductase FabG [Pseudomonadales bacterium]